MAFLLNHWHCLLPVAGILIGAWLMGRGKSKNRDDRARDDRPEARRIN